MGHILPSQAHEEEAGLEAEQPELKNGLTCLTTGVFFITDKLYLISTTLGI